MQIHAPRLNALPGTTHLVRLRADAWEHALRSARATGRVADGPLSVEPMWGPALAETARPLAQIDLLCADAQRAWKSRLTLGERTLVIDDREGVLTRSEGAPTLTEPAETITVGLAPHAALRTVMEGLLPQRAAVIGEPAEGCEAPATPAASLRNDVAEGIRSSAEARSAEARSADAPSARPPLHSPVPLAADGPVTAQVHLRTTAMGADGAPLVRARSWSAAEDHEHNDGDDVLGAALPLGTGRPLASGAALVEAPWGSVPQEVVADVLAGLAEAGHHLVLS